MFKFQLEQYSKGKSIKFEIIEAEHRDFPKNNLILAETDLYVVRNENGQQV